MKTKPKEAFKLLFLYKCDIYIYKLVKELEEIWANKEQGT